MIEKHKKLLIIALMVSVLIVITVVAYFHYNPSRGQCLNGGKRNFIGVCSPSGEDLVPM